MEAEFMKIYRGIRRQNGAEKHTEDSPSVESELTEILQQLGDLEFEEESGGNQEKMETGGVNAGSSEEIDAGIREVDVSEIRELQEMVIAEGPILFPEEQETQTGGEELREVVADGYTENNVNEEMQQDEQQRNYFQGRRRSRACRYTRVEHESYTPRTPMSPSSYCPLCVPCGCLVVNIYMAPGMIPAGPAHGMAPIMPAPGMMPAMPPPGMSTHGMIPGMLISVPIPPVMVNVYGPPPLTNFPPDVTAPPPYTEAPPVPIRLRRPRRYSANRM